MPQLLPSEHYCPGHASPISKIQTSTNLSEKDMAFISIEFSKIQKDEDFKLDEVCKKLLRTWRKRFQHAFKTSKYSANVHHWSPEQRQKRISLFMEHVLGLENPTEQEISIMTIMLLTKADRNNLDITAENYSKFKVTFDKPTKIQVRKLLQDSFA